jgi:hypothetical protein
MTVAYDLYKEVVLEAFAEFGFETEGEARKCFMEFYEFCDQLSKQGLQYNPEDQFYKGDSNMRVNRKKRKSARSEEGERRGRGCVSNRRQQGRRRASRQGDLGTAQA